MFNPAAFETTTVETSASETTGDRRSIRYHHWLDEARRATSNPGILRLIDDVHDDLAALGPIDDTMAEVVHGALESVAAAIHTEDLIAHSFDPEAPTRHPAAASR